MMRRGEDPSNEIPAEEFEGCDIHFTADIRLAQRAALHRGRAHADQLAEHPRLGPLLAPRGTVGRC